MNLNKLFIITFFIIGLIWACSEKKTSEDEISKTKDTLASYIAPKINPKSDNFTLYAIDTAKSKIHWNSSHHFGGLKYKKGNLAFNNNKLTDALFTIDMNSITNTDIEYELMNGTLVNVLKSVEFFNTEAYPEAHFELNNITEISDHNYKFSGNFIIFNKGISTDFEGIITLKNDSLFFNSKSIILDRTDWGIYYLSDKNPNPKEGEEGFYVSDTIMIDTHIIATKQ